MKQQPTLIIKAKTKTQNKASPHSRRLKCSVTAWTNNQGTARCLSGLEQSNSRMHIPWPRDEEGRGAQEGGGRRGQTGSRHRCKTEANSKVEAHSTSLSLSATNIQNRYRIQNQHCLRLMNIYVLKSNKNIDYDGFGVQ
jgi:hypothetical protein